MKLKLFEILWIHIIIYQILWIHIIALPIENQSQDLQKNIPLPFNFDLDPEHPISSLRNPRDSYGNPLPSLNGETDIKNNNGKRVVEANGYLFQLPSYASGITDIKPPSDELLPPIVNNEEQNQNDKNKGIEKPILDLLPPLPSRNSPEEQKDTSTNEIKDNQQDEEPNDFTTEVPTEKDEPNIPVKPFSSFNNQQGQKTPEKDVPPTFNVPIQNNIPSLQPLQPIKPNFGFDFNSFIPPPPPQVTQVISSSSVSGQKYTGGFGGAPGILGEQKVVGYAIQSDGSVKDPDHQHHSASISSISGGQGIHHSVSFASASASGSTFASSSNSNGKYSGGFGGPPGILVPFDIKQ